MKSYDIIIIGGGPGGYSAAIRAAQLGAKVLLIEEDKLGGTCLNKGCIPTKALYQNARMVNDLKRAETFGIRLEGFSIDFGEIMQRKQQITDRLREGVEKLVRANAVELAFGKGRFVSAGTVKVTDSGNNERIFSAKNIVIATGSAPVKPKIEGFGLPGVMVSDDVLSRRN
jgi:dihydrolipoamide dehydrogenase